MPPTPDVSFDRASHAPLPARAPLLRGDARTLALARAVGLAAAVGCAVVFAGSWLGVALRTGSTRGVPAKADAAIAAIVLAAALVAGFGAVRCATASLASEREIERERAKEALAQSEARLRLLLDGARDHAIYALDLAGSIVQWNKSAERLAGYGADEILGRGFATLFTPEEVANGVPEAELARAAHDGRSEYAGWRVRKDGTRFWGNIVLSALREEQGRLEGFVVVARDMTAVKHAEEQIEAYAADLEASEQRYRRIVETAAEGVWLIAADGTTSFLDARGAAMLGVAAEDVTGKELGAVFGACSRARAVLERQVTSPEPAQGELALTRADGTAVWLAAQTTPLFDATGCYEGALAMMSDITERKRVREELERYHAHLEDLVQQRTRELEENNAALELAGDELRAAREAAEAASRKKSAFLAIMSHEIRTPMNAILGFAQLLRREPGLTDAQRGRLDTILQNGQRLLEILNDVLDLSRIEAGRVELHTAPCDLRRTFAEVDQLFRAVAAERGLALRVEVAASVPHTAMTDAGKLRQVLVNLVGNAIKFTERGEIAVLAHADPAKTRLFLEVRDTGQGISPEDQARLFRPFEQTASGARAGGTGLGLAICRELVRRLGGDIRVSSAVGRGSVFHVEVAIEAIDDGAAPADPASWLAPSEADPRAAPPRRPSRAARPTTLPAEIVPDLRAAALAADLERLLELVALVEPRCPDVAKELRGRAERFDYEGVQRAIAEAS